MLLPVGFHLIPLLFFRFYALNGLDIHHTNTCTLAAYHCLYKHKCFFCEFWVLKRTTCYIKVGKQLRSFKVEWPKNLVRSIVWKSETDWMKVNAIHFNWRETKSMLLGSSSKMSSVTEKSTRISIESICKSIWWREKKDK